MEKISAYRNALRNIAANGGRQTPMDLIPEDTAYAPISMNVGGSVPAPTPVTVDDGEGGLILTTSDRADGRPILSPQDVSARSAALENLSAASMVPTVNPESGDLESMPEADARAAGRVVVPKNEAASAFSTQRVQESLDNDMKRDLSTFNAQRASAPVSRPASRLGAGPAAPTRSVERATMPATDLLSGEQAALSAPVNDPGAEPKPGVDEDGFAAAQSEGNRRRLLAGLGMAADHIGAAISGGRANPAFYERLSSDADLPVRDYLAAKQQSAAEAKSAEEAALKDPGSDASKRFQAYVSRAFPGVYNPQDIALMTAADAQQVMNMGEMQATLQARKAEQEANRAAEADLLNKRQTFEAGESQKQRALQRELAAQRNDSTLTPTEREQMRISAEDRKRQAQLAERNVGGFEFDPANPPSADGAKQMATVAKARDEMLASLNAMEGIFNRVGTEVGGDDASVMESHWKNITDQARIIADMGVPNGNDYVMLAKQVPNPVGAGAMLTRNSTIAAKFPALRQQIREKVDATARAYKFRPAGQQAAGSSQRMAAPTDASGRMELDSGLPPRQPGRRRLRMKDGTIAFVPEADAAEALRDPDVAGEV